MRDVIPFVIFIDIMDLSLVDTLSKPPLDKAVSCGSIRAQCYRPD